MTGRYIVFEGVDYSGKSSTLQLLAKLLKDNHNIDSVVVGNPGATPIGASIRKMVKDPDVKADRQTRAILFAADNQQFQVDIAKPLESTDTWLLSDRNNFLSSMAYQIVDGVPLENLKRCHSVVSSPRMIDICFIFDIDYDTWRTRRESRGSGKDYFERDGAHFLKLREAYNKLLHDHQNYLSNFVCKDLQGDPRIIPINAWENQNIVLEKIYQLIKACFIN